MQRLREEMGREREEFGAGKQALLTLLVRDRDIGSLH